MSEAHQIGERCGSMRRSHDILSFWLELLDGKKNKKKNKKIIMK